MIAFLHTSKIHIAKFDNLVKKHSSKTEIKHFVNEDLLNTALKTGQIDRDNFKVQIEKIKQENPDMIICTCSTYGGECENIRGVKRIDQPVAEYLISNYSRIALAYTARSTLAFSKELLSSLADNRNADLEIIECDCTDCWQFYESSDFENYEKCIAEKIKLLKAKFEVVFLAQASMEGAKNYLEAFDKEILSSPEFGVIEYLKEVKGNSAERQ